MCIYSISPRKNSVVGINDTQANNPPFGRPAAVRDKNDVLTVKDWLVQELKQPVYVQFRVLNFDCSSEDKATIRLS